MEQYRVEITKETLQDMEDIYNYIAIELLSPENAIGQYNRIADEILTLDMFPQRYRIMDSEPEKQMELRRMIVDTEYNIYHNSIDIYTYAGYILRIDCWEAEKNLKTTPGSECALNALAIDNPIEYARLYLDGTMQMWIDAEDSLELW